MTQSADSYRSILHSSQGLYKEKGSKFIAIAFPIETEDELKPILSELRKEYYDARHHCYAYVLGKDKLIFRTNDDGEPSGSAGKPIFGQFLSLDISDVLVVVIRYFGGTKLGVSGLINAYKTSTREALENAEIRIKTLVNSYSVEFQYAQMNSIMQIVKDENLQILRTSFELQCNLEFYLPKSDADGVLEKFKLIPMIKTSFIKEMAV